MHASLGRNLKGSLHTLVTNVKEQSVEFGEETMHADQSSQASFC